MSKAIKAIEEIEEVLDEFQDGVVNPSAISKINSLLSTVQAEYGRYDYVRQQVGSIREYVGILYSERKHQKHGGPSQVKGFIFSGCMTLRDNIDQITRQDDQ